MRGAGRRILVTCTLHATALFAAVPARADNPPGGAPGYNEPIAKKAPDHHEEVDDEPHARDGHPLAGYHNGLFYLRDHNDNFHLYIQGRAQLDWYSYLGSGVADTPLKPTLFVRRVRPEVSGEVLGKFRYFISGDFGATAIDNPLGRNVSTAQAVRFSAQATDVYVNYRKCACFNVMVGQMDLPFTMENRTSDKYLPFMEKSMAVRTVSVPNGGKDLGAMVWGETKDRVLYYSIGPYMGEGMNRPNVDSRIDVYGRFFVHPLALTNALSATDPLRDLQFGTSFHYGSRDSKWVVYDYAPLNTAGAWTYWAPTYVAANGQVLHIMPSNDQLAMAAELRLPVDRFDLTAEGVVIRNGTREAYEETQSTNTERIGTMSGYAYYATLGVWLFGPRDVNGVPGYGNPPRLDWTKSDSPTPPQALQVVARWEQVHLEYRGSSRGGVPDANNVDGDIRADAFTLGANFWASRHVRMTLEYVHNAFPSSDTAANRALAPGNALPPEHRRPDAHELHEILARFAVAL